MHTPACVRRINPQEGTKYHPLVTPTRLTEFLDERTNGPSSMRLNIEGK